MKQPLPQIFLSNKIKFIKSLSSDASFQKVVLHEQQINVNDRFKIDTLSREEKLEIVKNVILDEELDSILLLYELSHLRTDTYIEDLEEFVTFSIGELARYQNHIGGNNLDDDEWIKCNNEAPNCRYYINNKMVVLYNSTNTTKLHDSNTMYFLNKITSHLQKFSKSICVDYKVTEDEKNEIVWVAIFFEKLDDIIE